MNKVIAILLVLMLTALPAEASVLCTDLQEENRTFMTSEADSYFHADQNCSDDAFPISAEAAIEFRKNPCPKCTGIAVNLTVVQLNDLEMITVEALEAENIALPEAVYSRDLGDGQYVFLTQTEESLSQWEVTVDGQQHQGSLFPCAADDDSQGQYIVLYDSQVSCAETVETKTIQTTADASGTFLFLTGNCTLWKCDDLVLWYASLLNQDLTPQGSLVFGNKQISAEEYHAQYGDYYGAFPYSEEEKAYVNEMNGMYREIDVPEYSIDAVGAEENEYMIYLCVLTHEEYEALRKEDTIGFRFTEAGEETTSVTIAMNNAQE